MWRVTSEYRWSVYDFWPPLSLDVDRIKCIKSLVAAPSRCRRRLGHHLDHRTALITVCRRPVPMSWRNWRETARKPRPLSSSQRRAALRKHELSAIHAIVNKQTRMNERLCVLLSVQHSIQTRNARTHYAYTGTHTHAHKLPNDGTRCYFAIYYTTAAASLYSNILLLFNHCVISNHYLGDTSITAVEVFYRVPLLHQYC